MESPQLTPHAVSGARSGLTPTVLAWGLVALGLPALLWNRWGENPELSHGYAAPLLFVILLVEARSHEGLANPGLRRLSRLALPLSLLSCLALLLAQLYATAFGWAHANAAFLAALAFSLGGLGLLFSTARTAKSWLPLNWQSVSAFLLWPLCAPLPPGSYSRLAAALQAFVSGGVLHALNLLGVAATRHGNVIELASTSVGVEEACSGIRSLIACLFVSLFFSAVFLRRPLHRLVLILLAVPFALGMNFLRSLLLTLLADSGRDITGPWHDLTGHAILLGTAALLLLSTLALRSLAYSPRPGPTAPASPQPQPRRRRLLNHAAGVPALAALMALLPLLRPAPSPAPAPDLGTLLPAALPGWSVVTDSSIQRFNSILDADTLLQRHYVSGDTRISLYAAYWAPGRSNPGRIALHTPEACWPGGGWQLVVNPPTVSRPAEASRAEYRCFLSPAGAREHVYYWLLQGGRPVPLLNPYRPDELLKLFISSDNRPGDTQLFIRVSSNKTWQEICNTAPLHLLRP